MTQKLKGPFDYLLVVFILISDELDGRLFLEIGRFLERLGLEK